MGDILLTQDITRVERVTYSREQVIDMLVSVGADRESTETMTDRELGHVLVATVNSNDQDVAAGLYERLVDDAQGSGEIVDVGEWEVTEIYGDAVPKVVNK